MRRLIQFGSKKHGAKAPVKPSTSSSVAAPAVSLPAQATGAVLQGVQVMCEGTDPVVDIVAVHGLNGHCERTWTAGNSIDSVNWLRDLLPHDLPNARILSWGYDANTHSGSRVSCQYLFDHARTLVSDLCLERQITETSKRPIIFVAHSLGGIIVKSALIHSDAACRGALEEHRAIKLSTYGILFMGTPHQGGSGVALGKLMVNVASVFMAADDQLLQHLERDSEWLQQQLGQYGPISGDVVTKFAFEEYETPTVLGKPIMVVPRASALVPGAADGEAIAIHADHIHMVKFGSKTDPGYRTVSGHLQLMAARAGTSIGERWDTEAKVNAVHSNEPIASFAVQFSVPVARVDHFVGRSEELDAIHRELEHDGSRKTAVVHGLGGIGKTQLALAYEKRHRDEYSAVFWVNSKDVDTLKRGYAAAARRIYREHPSLVHLKAVAEGSDLNEAAEAVRRWLSSPGNDRWLVIFDNHDTPGTFDIRPFLPEADHGAILITTRSSQLQLGRPVAVKKLRDIEHSLEILSQTSRRDRLSLDADARKLAEELDGLPLALATAGAYLHLVPDSFAEYLQSYKESWTQLQQDTPQLLSYEDRALYSTWNISLNHVKQQSSLAAKLLQLWAYFDNQDVWLELLQECRRSSPVWLSELTEDRRSFNVVIRVLCDHALVEANTRFADDIVESRGYSMHRCVHLWTTQVVNDGWDDRMAGLALICVGLHVPKKDRSKYWVLDRRLIRHANRCRQSLNSRLADQDYETSTLYAIGGLGNLYARHDELDKAEGMYLQALAGFEKALGSSHTLTLQTVDDLGLLYRDQGKLDKAEEMYQRALQGFEEALGRDHTSTLQTVNNLGLLYADQGKLDKAEKMYQRALQGFEKALGRDHTSTLDTVNNLGLLYKDQGKLDKAEEMYQRALQGYEKALGRDHTSTLQTVNNLGVLYKDQGKLDKAEEMYQRALQGYEKALGPNHTTTLNAAEYLSKLYISLGRLEEAERLRRKLLQGRQYALETNPDRISGDVVLLSKGSASLNLRDNSDLTSLLSFDVPPSLTSGWTLSETSGIAKTAAEQFVEILIRDGTIQHLFPIVIEKAGLEKFKRNFFRLLTKYAADLRVEANTSIQFEAARLVRSRANFIVYLIAENIQHEETSTPPQIAVPESERELRVERYLQQQVQQNQSYCEPTISSIDDRPPALDPEGYSDDDDESCEPERPNLINLDEVRKFMVESGAYAQLRTSFCNFVFPPEEVVDVGSRLTGMIKSATPTPYRLHWICSCGHKHYDDFVETIPGSITKLANLLQANGIRSQPEMRPKNSAFFELYNLYLLLRNSVVCSTKTAMTFLRYVSRQNTAHSSTSIPTGLPNRVSSPTTTLGGQQATQSVNIASHIGHQPSKTSGSTQSIATQHHQTSTGPRNDYILLCSDEKGWLTTRDDLNVSQMKSDRELFDSFQSRLKSRKRWTRQFASLKTIQSISFVKFAIRQNQEVDQLQLDQIPPPKETHYDFHERVPGYVPPIGNRYFMHRFSNSAHCGDSTFCLSQIPKRLHVRPHYGSAPDHSTAWGLYFHETLDLARLCLCGLFAFLFSLVFGVVWAVDKKSIQDGFAVASYILALEALTIGTVQVGIGLDWI